MAAASTICASLSPTAAICAAPTACRDYKGAEIPANWLSHEEMARLVRLFVDNGVRKVRLTGGEPLTRGGVAGLAAAIAAMPGLRDLSLSTNGTRLARHARSLRQAGVQRLNVSLDTLDAAGFQAITGRDCLADVLDGLRRARGRFRAGQAQQRGACRHARGRGRAAAGLCPRTRLRAAPDRAHAHGRLRPRP